MTGTRREFLELARTRYAIPIDHPARPDGGPVLVEGDPAFSI